MHGLSHDSVSTGLRTVANSSSPLQTDIIRVLEKLPILCEVHETAGTDPVFPCVLHCLIGSTKICHIEVARYSAANKRISPEDLYIVSGFVYLCVES